MSGFPDNAGVVTSASNAGTSVPCLFCGGPSAFALTAADRNWATTSERFIYNRCQVCDTVFLVDVPSDLSRYYGRDYHRFGGDGTPEGKENPYMLRVERYRVGLLRRHVEPGPLIDIGAGIGGFAAAASTEGFDVTAIEMDTRCCAYLEGRLSIRAICTDQPMEQLLALPSPKVISLWHVLEHLREPREMLTAAAEKLQPGGLLALGVPNPRSLQFRLLGARWAHLDAPRHLSLIPAETLSSQLERLGLRRVEAVTDDPFGRHCNLHGWAWALRRHPASGDPPRSVMRLARAITLAMGPVEQTGSQGTALTLVFMKGAPS